MSYQRQGIGNRGVSHYAHPLRRPSYPVRTRSVTQAPSYQAPIPIIQGFRVTRDWGASSLPVQAPAAVPEPSSGGGLASLFGGGSGSALGTGSGFNLGQLKNIVDRLGGIEGIMDTFGKIQKMVESLNQMSPMIKLLMGAFKKKKSNDTSSGRVKPRRRRRRNRRDRRQRNRR